MSMMCTLTASEKEKKEEIALLIMPLWGAKGSSAVTFLLQAGASFAPTARDNQ